MKISFNRLNLLIVITLIIGTLSMTGCASTRETATLTSLIGNNTFDTYVVSKIPNDEISIRTNVSNNSYISASPAGLIVGIFSKLIEKGVNKANASNAEKRVTPLLESTADIEFSRLFWEQLEPALEQSDWLKVRQLDKRILGLTAEETDNIASPYMVLNTSFQLSECAQVLIVKTNASLYIHNNENNEENPEYSNSYTYFSSIVGKNDEKDQEAIELWKANNAEVYKAALNEGIQQNIAMIQRDLLNKSTFLDRGTGNTMQVKFKDPLYDTKRKIKGRTITRSDNRLIVQEESGSLISLGNDLIINEKQL
ncbi:MAG: hypothetical protein C1941_00115 [Prosthecochloris sp.]|nr:hypothetical protein [Prosthecochloris sp.]